MHNNTQLSLLNKSISPNKNFTSNSSTLNRSNSSHIIAPPDLNNGRTASGGNNNNNNNTIINNNNNNISNGRSINGNNVTTGRNISGGNIPNYIHSSTMMNNSINDSNISTNNSYQGYNTAFAPPKRTQSPFRDLSNPYLKQINDQQRPLYTPAVLRVMKNPSPSSEVGFDVHKLPCEREESFKNSSAISVSSTASSIIDYWNYMIGKVPNKEIEGPTREHWKPDSFRFNCAQCGKLFNYMTDSRRKHHCRSCGDIFCGDCLKNYIYLDKNAHFTLFGSNWDELDQEENTDNKNNRANDETNNDYNRNQIIVSSSNVLKKVSNTNTSTNTNEIIDDTKYLCKVCLNCFQQYEEYVLDHTTRDHNLGTNGKDLHKVNNNDHKDTAIDTKNIPVDWNWSSF
ncbi:hypothetical protein C6P40_001296 [Pichia californica]|uniref:FYVE-type domain-containing protein n=1 Tax=Pichia californica TaxID=460514 RepID=A0A9P6WLD5_9ASCO|nr:hypothetical protein C6P40_001296 [[Candida] californica]